MGVSENLKRGVTELALLCLLSEQDMYGYQMAQALAAYSDSKFTLMESSMYPTLYRLQDRGFISSREITVTGRRKRMYYHLEPAGRAYLHTSLAEYLQVQQGLRGILAHTGNLGKEACS